MFQFSAPSALKHYTFVSKYDAIDTFTIFISERNPYNSTNFDPKMLFKYFCCSAIARNCLEILPSIGNQNIFGESFFIKSSVLDFLEQPSSNLLGNLRTALVCLLRSISNCIQHFLGVANRWCDHQMISKNTEQHPHHNTVANQQQFPHHQEIPILRGEERTF